jgi:hypothetical protein
MGLISTISRLGREDCNSDCLPIQCFFDCATCLDFQFRWRLTWVGIANTPNCNTCGELNRTLVSGDCYTNRSDCSLSDSQFLPTVSCTDIQSVSLGISQNQIQVTLQGFFWSARWRLTAPNVVEVLCGGGIVSLPFLEHLLPFPEFLQCNANGSTAVLEIVPTVDCGSCLTPVIQLTERPPEVTVSDMATFGWVTIPEVVDSVLYSLDGGPFLPVPSNPFTLTLDQPQIHTIEIKAITQCGEDSTTYTWEQIPIIVCDPPTVAFINTPPAVTSDTTATFTWSTTGTVGLTLLRLDGGAPTAPISSNVHNYFFLAPGFHTLEIEVLSLACGNSSASYTWEITGGQPCVTPTVTLTQTPPVQTANTSATFSWQTTGTVLLQFIRLDGGPLQNPSGNNTHTFNNLAPGTHQVEVQVQSGACGDASAFYVWEIDTPCVPPQVTFTQTPSDPTTSTTATFVWNTTGTAGTTTLRLDGGTPVSPSNPATNTHVFTGIAPGTHVVEVIVNSPCGNATDSHIWLVEAGTTLCEKVNSLFQLIGTAEPNVDVEITFSGVAANQCGLPNYNRTYLIPGPHVPINNCPDVTVCETIRDDVGCGGISGTYPDYSWVLCPNLNPVVDIGGAPALAWLLCTGCTSPGLTTPPMIRVRSTVPSTGSGMQIADFAATGTTQVTALVDQMLATGSCQIPFFQQTPPGPFPVRNFQFATCTIRII